MLKLRKQLEDERNQNLDAQAIEAVNLLCTRAYFSYEAHAMQVQPKPLDDQANILEQYERKNKDLQTELSNL